MRKLEPHIGRNHVDGSATDVYLYAVDPKFNVVVDMDHLQKLVAKVCFHDCHKHDGMNFRAIQTKQNEIERRLDGYKVLALASGTQERNMAKTQRLLLSSLEIGVVILGCIVFIGAFTTAVCVICIRRKKRRYVLTEMEIK